MAWAFPKSISVRSSAFTLIELLMVIFILGIAAAVLVPQLNVGAEQTRLVTAARSIVQASRYARTMALLHQTETELVCNSETGTVEVRAKSTGSVSGVLSSMATYTEIRDLEDPAELPETDEAITVNTNVAADVATAQSFADEVNAKFKSEGVKFEFMGYTDTLEEENGKDAKKNAEEPDATFTVVFKSNGTCRPFKIKVFNEDEDFFEVSVDMIGKAKIEGYGDEE